jgi:hypothetical protein
VDQVTTHDNIYKELETLLRRADQGLVLFHKGHATVTYDELDADVELTIGFTQEVSL